MKACPQMEFVIKALTQKYGVDLAQRNQRLWLKRADQALLLIDTLEAAPAIGIALRGPDAYTQLYVVATAWGWIPSAILVLPGEFRQYVMFAAQPTLCAAPHAQACFAEVVEQMAQDLWATRWLEEGKPYLGY